MMTPILRAASVVVLLGLTALPAQPVLAQDIDATANTFGRQKVLRDPLTRGLTIAPVTQQGAAGNAAAEPARAPEPDGNFAVLEKADQVNVNIRFDFDSAALRADQLPILANICAAAKQAGVERMLIVGHTDSSGTKAYNERLSRLRAEEVKRHLAETCAIPLDQMEAVGKGKQYLFDPADPRGEVNRRVEFQALG